MHFQGIEEPFHENQGAVAPGKHSMEIEQHLGFQEAGRKAVLGLGMVCRPARIGDEFAKFVMDWNDHPAPK